uniref:EOG090X0I6M n=1 Tax=Simocephalus serrulatus TaxID=117539 RepID=A0A4Y7NMW2_9CRUS|nr:EOG090X0I6M [Simocephalus serrulatus]SVE94608.1 EOG090X0I6M [Simocephalus serrulatus]
MILVPVCRIQTGNFSVAPQLRQFHASAACFKVQAGRYKISQRRDKPLTYEMANPPHYIAHRKSWNSWDTTSLQDGLRAAETSLEDVFIRRFMTGTWHDLFCSEIIIKRQHNLIRIAGLVRQGIPPRKMYFLLGYSEELLASWLQCPVKLELQTIERKEATIFKYI